MGMPQAYRARVGSLSAHRGTQSELFKTDHSKRTDPTRRSYAPWGDKGSPPGPKAETKGAGRAWPFNMLFKPLRSTVDALVDPRLTRCVPDTEGVHAAPKRRRRGRSKNFVSRCARPLRTAWENACTATHQSAKTKTSSPRKS